MNQILKSSKILRWGLAFVFVYATIEIFVHPANFLKYTPSFITLLIPLKFFLIGFACFEVLLALWLISGYKTQYAALISFFLLIGIVFLNLGHFQVLFRNVAIAAASLSLYILDRGKITLS